MLKRICRWNGCNKLIDYTELYCPEHKKVHEAYRRKQYKDRDKAIKLDAKEDKLKQFYKSKEWGKAREDAMQKLLYIDIVELYRTGKVIQGVTVHHITEIRTAAGWDRRLDIDNLIYLTESNHRHIHYLYDKSSQSREQAQRMLSGLLLRFRQEYKLFL